MRGEVGSAASPPSALCQTYSVKRFCQISRSGTTTHVQPTSATSPRPATLPTTVLGQLRCRLRRRGPHCFSAGEESWRGARLSPVTHHAVVGVVQVLLTKRPAVVALPAPFRQVVTVLTRVSELVKVVTNEPRQSGLAPTTRQPKDAVTPFPNGDLQPHAVHDSARDVQSRDWNSLSSFQSTLETCRDGGTTPAQDGVRR